MKYLPIILMIFFTVGGCNDKSNNALRTKKATKILMGKKAKWQKWQLISQYDPYNGGKYYRPDSSNSQYFILINDGSFREYDTFNYSEGSWLMNKSRDRVALVYLIQNGIKIPPEKRDTTFRYELKTISPDSLVLAIQGRHGMMAKTYLNVSTELNSDSIWIDSTGIPFFPPDNPPPPQEE